MLSLTVKKVDVFKFDGVAESDKTAFDCKQSRYQECEAL